MTTAWLHTQCIQELIQRTQDEMKSWTQQTSVRVNKLDAEVSMLRHHQVCCVSLCRISQILCSSFCPGLLAQTEALKRALNDRSLATAQALEGLRARSDGSADAIRARLSDADDVIDALRRDIREGVIGVCVACHGARKQPHSHVRRLPRRLAASSSCSPTHS